jgi:hypothetical protein
MAGTIHGINNSTEFALYEQPDENSCFLGFFAVREANEFTSTLEVKDPMAAIAIPAFALPIKALRVAFANKPGIHKVADALQREVDAAKSKSYRYSFVHKDQAALEVDILEGKIVFNNVNSRVQERGYSRMPYRVEIDETRIICNILKAAGNFDLFLNLTSGDRRIRDNVTVEFIEVMRPTGEKYGPAVRLEGARDLCREKCVEVTAGDTMYGIKVTNNSPFQLYPHLFLFDCSDLSIGKHHSIQLQLESLTLLPESYYKPPLVVATDKDAPLKPGCALTIGYGTSGEQPWNHYLRNEGNFHQDKVLQEKQHFDVNVFKLFLTTKLVDLSFIEQASPFLGNPRGTKKVFWDQIDAWDAISLFVSICGSDGPTSFNQ